jgi:hypothetical protein
MNDPFFRTHTVNDSGLGCLAPALLVGLLLASIASGWVVKGLLILLAFLPLAPLFGRWIFRWWLRRNLVEDRCPACNFEFTAFIRTECQCPNCGERIEVRGGKFASVLPPDTIDVEAIEVPARPLDPTDNAG